jgi:NTE family protein
MSTAFVLSGGGSLGAVQVGMLQALSERGIRPDLLVGTSAGAVNALWVAQHGMSRDSLTRLAAIWSHLRRRDIFPLRTGQVLRAVLGRSPALSSSEHLGELVSSHCGIDDLGAAAVPVHLVATDLLRGNAVLMSSGSPVDAVRASAAVPGIYEPVWVGGRWLVDGALAAPSGVSLAVGLGATEVFVLPTGVPCALPHPPRSAVAASLHALTLLIEQRLVAEVQHLPGKATIRLVPPLCPVSVPASDFSRASELIQRAHQASATWIEEGGLDVPEPARFLSLHTHDRPAARQH